MQALRLLAICASVLWPTSASLAKDFGNHCQVEANGPAGSFVRVDAPVDGHGPPSVTWHPPSSDPAAIVQIELGYEISADRMGALKVVTVGGWIPVALEEKAAEGELAIRFDGGRV